MLRAVVVLACSVAAAAGLAALKGRGLDSAYVIGNSSALYLLVPFIAGLLMPRRVSAAGLGVAATAAALVAFYFTASSLYLGRLSLDFSLGRWFLAEAASGTLLGSIGQAARRRQRLLSLLPALLLLEPAATAAATALGHGSGALLDASLLARAVEGAVGAIALLLDRHQRRRAAAR